MIDTGLRRTLLAGLLPVLAACAAPATAPADAGSAPVPPSAAGAAAMTTTMPTAPTMPTMPATGGPADPAAAGANELGDVPVLMYHRITAQPKSVYDRTPAEFGSELERLAGERYVPVTAAQYTAGEIDIPAGAHPVVLTFDDGDPSQLTLTPRGEPAPDTAVAILRDVAGRHPEFRPVATFYVNRDPFGDPGGTRTLPWLRDHGMDIGNHTLGHANLRQAGAAGAQREIAQGDAAIRHAAPGVEPATIALPFGVRPVTAELALAGSDNGVSYQYRGAFLVGADPAPSPYSADFARAGIPRIRSQGPDGPEAEFASTGWLDKLTASPARRYTSDGIPDHVTYPRGSSRAVAVAYQGSARPY